MLLSDGVCTMLTELPPKGRSKSYNAMLKLIMNSPSFGFLDGPLSPTRSSRPRPSWETSIKRNYLFTSYLWTRISCHWSLKNPLLICILWVFPFVIVQVHIRHELIPVKHKDPTCLHLAARALMSMQQRHGLFPRIIGKGDHARRIADLLLRMRTEWALDGDSVMNGPSSLGSTPSSSIESVILIDRGVDFLTPLLTQLTYEGLIDELWGIQHNQTEVDSSVAGSVPAPQQAQPSSAAASSAPRPAQGMKRKLQLDSSDKLYDQIRDANFATVGPILNKVARRLESDYESRHVAKSTAELREFVNKLPGYQAEQQSLKLHTGLAEEILKFTKSDLFTSTLKVQQHLAAGADPSAQHESIEELIAREAPLPMVLRLLCIESCVSGGLRPRDLDIFKRAILHAYGFQHLLTLDTLEKLQLLQSRASTSALMIPVTMSGNTQGTKTNYTYLRKALNLIVEDVDEQDPNDIAYVYSGYAPLSVRLVQCVLQKKQLLSMTKGTTSGGANAVSSAAQGWRGFDDTVAYARGKTFDEIQKGEDKAVRARTVLNGHGDKKTVIVFFIGGVTYAEAAALRYISRQDEGKLHLLMLRTLSKPCQG